MRETIRHKTHAAKPSPWWSIIPSCTRVDTTNRDTPLTEIPRRARNISQPISSAFALFSQCGARKRTETVKLLPRDNPRTKKVVMNKIGKHFGAETHKSFFFVSASWNALSAVGKGKKVDGMFVQQIKLHLLDVCFWAVNSELQSNHRTARGERPLRSFVSSARLGPARLRFGCWMPNKSELW